MSEEANKEERAAVSRRMKNQISVEKYREKNREKINQRARERYAADPERNKRAHASWFAQNKDKPEVKEKANALARKGYKNRVEAEILELTGRERPEHCELCGRGGRICFDHCHQSKEFRGWLCINCNLALGHAQDDPVLLRKLADYVERKR